MAKLSMTAIKELLQEVFVRPEGPRELLQTLIQAAMEAEVDEHLGARRHERTDGREGYRNGHKPRNFRSRVGELAFQVPQVRNAEPYHPSMFARFQRHERALLVACAEMYFQGVSTAKVQEVLQTMGGLELSAMSVSRVAAELDEKLAEFQSRRLSGKVFKYLMVDARYEKVRRDGKVLSTAVLVTVGFATDGTREILDWRLADSESASSWGELFAGLKDHGLEGVELVVSDAHKGIQAAVQRHFQGACWQRCRVHFKRELGRLVSYKQLRNLMADLAGVYKGSDKAECLRRGQEMAGKWQEASPKVAQTLLASLEDTLVCLDFPEAHHRKLASTNLLENIMKRLKARTRVVGVFPNTASCHRLIGAQLLELHEQWQIEPRGYFLWRD